MIKALLKMLYFIFCQKDSVGIGAIATHKHMHTHAEHFELIIWQFDQNLFTYFQKMSFVYIKFSHSNQSGSLSWVQQTQMEFIMSIVT